MIKVFVTKMGQKIKAVHEKDVGTSTWQWFQREYENHLPGDKIHVIDWNCAMWAVGNSSLTSKKAKEAINEYCAYMMMHREEMM